MGGALERHGGEILKFMGDALLAIFPCQHATAQGCTVAASALAAARDGLGALARLNERRRSERRPLLAAGVALSIGDVHYGNIGVADRLDFTVIGPAVNLAARIQGLTAGLGEPILLSGEVGHRLTAPARSCGRHALKGVEGLTEVFAP
jgi:adenylate cyclase